MTTFSLVFNEHKESGHYIISQNDLTEFAEETQAIQIKIGSDTYNAQLRQTNSFQKSSEVSERTSFSSTLVNKEDFAKADIVCLSGTLTEDSDSNISLVTTDSFLIGYVRTEEQTLEIKPVQSDSADSTSGHHYAISNLNTSSDDKKERTNYICSVTDKVAVDGIKKNTQPEQRQQLRPGQNFFTLSVDLGYEWYDVFTKAVPEEPLYPITYALSCIFQISDIYRKNFDVTMDVIYMHVWTDNKEGVYPYTSTNANTLLDQFSLYWINNHKLDTFIRNNTDLFHLMTFVKLDDRLSGLAQLNGEYALSSTYNISRNDFVAVMTHEIGHQLGATHNQAEKCNAFLHSGSIMCPNIAEMNTKSPYFSSNNKMPVLERLESFKHTFLPETAATAASWIPDNAKVWNDSSGFITNAADEVNILLPSSESVISKVRFSARIYANSSNNFFISLFANNLQKESDYRSLTIQRLGQEAANPLYYENAAYCFQMLHSFSAAWIDGEMEFIPVTKADSIRYYLVAKGTARCISNIDLSNNGIQIWDFYITFKEPFTKKTISSISFVSSLGTGFSIGKNSHFSLAAL